MSRTACLPGAFSVRSASMQKNPGACANSARLSFFQPSMRMAIPKKISTCSPWRIGSFIAGKKWHSGSLCDKYREHGVQAYSPNGHQAVTLLLLPCRATSRPGRHVLAIGPIEYLPHFTKEYCNGTTDPHAPWARPESVVGQHHSRHAG